MNRFIVLACLAIQALRADQFVVENQTAYDPYRVFWSNNDRILVSKSRRGEVRVWQTDTGTMIQALPPIEGMESKLTFDAGGALTAFRRDGHAVVVDRRTGREIWRSEENEINAIGPLTDSHITYATLHEVHRMDYRRNLKTGRWKWNSDTYCRDILPLADGMITAVMANRDAVILDAANLAELGKIAGTVNKPFYFAKSAAKGRQVFLCALNGVFLGDAKNPADGFRRLPLPGVAFSIAISATGDRLAVKIGSEIQIRSVATNEVILSIPSSTDINDMAWSDDGSRLAIATPNQGIRVIDTKAGEFIRNFGESRCFLTESDGANCVVSPNGRLIALWAEDHRLTIIDLRDMTAVVREPVPGMTPSWMKFTGARTLTAAYGSCYRFDEKGGLLGKLRAEDDSLGFQLAGPEVTALRTKSEVIYHDWRNNQPVELARHPMKIARRHVTDHNSLFSLAREGDDAGPLTLRMGPAWEKMAEVPPPVSDPSVDSLVALPQTNSLSWLNDEKQLVSFSLATGKLDLLREFPERLSLRTMTSPSAPEWLVIFKEPSATGTMDYEVVSAASGKTIYSSKPWESFRNEVDCIPVGVSPDRKHLWTCGPAGHPILVDLESGQPLLRIYTWNDGGIVFERPGGRFSWNDVGLARIRRVSEDLNASKPDQLPAAASDTSGIRTILSRVFATE